MNLIVKYDKDKKAIMTNDNGSYWQGYLGYPAIAYLMLVRELPFEEKFAQALREIEWKRINTKNKNDFEKTRQEVEQLMTEKGIDLREFHKYLKLVEDKIKELDLSLLGKKIPPPAGF